MSLLSFCVSFLAVLHLIALVFHFFVVILHLCGIVPLCSYLIDFVVIKLSLQMEAKDQGPPYPLWPRLGLFRNPSMCTYCMCAGELLYRLSLSTVTLCSQSFLHLLTLMKYMKTYMKTNKAVIVFK